MAKKVAGTAPSSTDSTKSPSTRFKADTGMVLYMLAFILCFLLSIAPLNRLAGATFLQALPTNTLLISVGTWLPIDLGFSSNAHDSQVTTHVVLLLAFIALAFLIYGLCAWSIQRRPLQDNYKRTLRLIWLGTCITGLVFILAPGMLSHDAFVYAGYGRVLAVHGANPYFVPLTTYPHDPALALDEWKNAPAAYGPLLLIICAFSSLSPDASFLQYLLTYRMLGFAAHLLNTLLVMNILRTMGHSPRTIALGTLLYAWNPLALLESCLGGHNDTFMVTLILLGMLYCVRAERKVIKSFSDLRYFIPSLVAFPLATLIKFTAAPLIVLLLIWIARKTLSVPGSLSTMQLRLGTSFSPSNVKETINRGRAEAGPYADNSKTGGDSGRAEAGPYPMTENSVHLEWRRMFLMVIAAGLLSGVLALAFYAPFWIGHSIPAILQSFTSPPSANQAYGSIMFAILKWIWAHGLPGQSWLAKSLYVLSLHSTWNAINLLTVIVTMSVGGFWIWRVPTTQALALASLGVLGALLIVTPWFFPWYVIWLVGLAAICVPIMHDRVARALVCSTLVFSASAFCIYLYYRGVPPLGSWIGFTFLTTIGPPILTLVTLLILPISRAR